MDMFASEVWWFVPGLAVGFLIGWLCGLGWARRARVVRPPARAVASDANVAEGEPTDAFAETPSTAGLAQSRIIDVGAARAAGFNLKHADDLTIIEGIGPKIDELFHANGITSFALLAGLSVPETLAILDHGGPAFQLTNPGSWARQASLASENRWAELKRLQEDLIGIGRPGGTSGV
ncbi:MAG: hypothetical protein ACREPX_09940 [Rhodanobacteraceae bacterium]